MQELAKFSSRAAGFTSMHPISTAATAIHFWLNVRGDLPAFHTAANVLA
jgi:hypothetical protein